LSLRRFSGLIQPPIADELTSELAPKVALDKSHTATMLLFWDEPTPTTNLREELAANQRSLGFHFKVGPYEIDQVFGQFVRLS
jgi:hypothetical protein